MLKEWLRGIETYLPLVTAVGVVMGAGIALFFGTLNSLYVRRRDLPVVWVSIRRQVDDLPYVVTFGVEAQPKWQVVGIRARGRKARLTFAAESIGPNRWRATGSWRRRLAYRAPVSDGTVFVHPDVPDRFRVSFVVSMRGRPRIRRRVDEWFVLPARR